MTYFKLISTTALVGTVVFAGPLSAAAQSHQRGRDSGRSGAATTRSDHGVVNRAVPRTGPPPRVIAPRVIAIAPYRPYYYRPSFRLGYGYSYPYGYGYGYPAYGYGYGYGSGYGYGYPVPPPGYLAAVPGRPYGGVRITDAPRDAEVFADGYYVGIVDDFDGVFQHLNLEAGPHRIEIRAPGLQPIAFDVRVEPGETITYRAAIRPY
jgi:hypothetical protein